MLIGYTLRGKLVYRCIDRLRISVVMCLQHERPCALRQVWQDRNPGKKARGCIAFVGHGQIGPSIAIHVTYDNHSRIIVNCEHRLIRERQRYGPRVIRI